MSCSAMVQRAFYRTFFNWGHFVGRRPFLVIIISFLLALMGSTRLILARRSPIPSETEQERLWVPQKAEAIDEKAAYEAAFPQSYRRNMVYFTTTPKGGNVLTVPFLTDVARFDALVTQSLNATEWEQSSGWTTVQNATYEGTCAASEGGCISIGHPLDLFRKADGSFELTSDAQILSVVRSRRGVNPQTYPPGSGRTFNLEAAFGGITYDASGQVTGAKSLAIAYLLENGERATDIYKRTSAWEDQLNLFVGPEWTNDEPISRGAADPGTLSFSSATVTAYPYTHGATSRELSKNISADLVSLQAGFMIILVYAVFIFARWTPVRSRSLLALAGIVSVGLSIAVAYGFTALLGFKLNPVVNVLPFVLIGIGVDDMFVLITALEGESSDLPVAERMGRTMGRAGVSITITSLTDLFAFILGSTSALPALSDFCAFAAVGITADFLLQISFFAGWMALDCYRENKNKPDCCPCLCSSQHATKAAQAAESGCCCCTKTYGLFPFTKWFDGPDAGLKAFLRNYYIPLLRRPLVKALVIVIFVGYCAFSAVFAAKLKQDFQ